MVLAPISLLTYKRLFLQKEPSILSTLHMLQEFVRYRALHSGLGMAWIVLSAFFVIAFPTVSSAMTSYTPTTSPYIKDREEKWLPVDTVQHVDYMVYDAQRVPYLNSNGSLPIAHMDVNASVAYPTYNYDNVVAYNASRFPGFSGSCHIFYSVFEILC
jgi:hypothetical protein